MGNLLDLYGDYTAVCAAISLFQWDRQVLMPPGGASARSTHVESLTRMAHSMLTGDEMLRALEETERNAAPGSDEAIMAERLRRDVDIERKLPAELVARKARVSSDAYEVWKKAKACSDFPALAPYLAQLFDIAKESAELLGYKDHPYDALIDLYEEGATHEDARRMFEGIKDPIVSLVQEIQDRGRKIDDRPLRGKWDPGKLRRFTEEAARIIGFDLSRGRLDLAPNAFCTSLAPHDVRMTTRPSDHVKGVISSSFHEMGHGLYEQGTPDKWAETPLAGGISLAVHESQSRLWENIVGRRFAFWKFFLPKLQSALPELSSVPLEQFYLGMNVVNPEAVRVGADELTYNLHILVRFELESEIVTDKLQVNHLPEAWNEKYRQYLGIVPENDGAGCLQDVHWSRGSIGYFPTYSMGNLVGAQVWEALQKDVPDTDGLMEKGDFAPILSWLQERIYSQGRRHRPNDLIRRVTGDDVKPDAWLRYAQRKYREMYKLASPGFQ